jgi:hypothetical protein
VHTRFLDSGDDLQDPRHTRVSLPIVGKGLSKSPSMCGRVEQRRGAYCYSCLLPSEVFTRRLLRKKRKKRRKQIRASHGPRWWSLMAEVFWRQSGKRGIGRSCSKGPQGIVRGQDREDSEALRCT